MITLPWSRDTSADPEGWTPDNPTHGHCAVAALIVQDVFGGDLLRCPIPGGSHYWNRLPDGSELDLTAGQFKNPVERVGIEVRSREYVLSFEATAKRYELLREQHAAGRSERRGEMSDWGYQKVVTHGLQYHNCNPWVTGTDRGAANE